MKNFALLASGVALVLLTSCASNVPDASASEEEQIEQPARASQPPHGNPLDVPDEATLPHVPGQ
ncbi:MAG TPA: hypothetical protein VGI85_03595 [Chthoniobacterales bacterium]|jgi:hypothetical protein